MKTYRAGIDIGSTTVKLVILDENSNMVYGRYRRHQANTQGTLAELLKEARQTAGECLLQIDALEGGGESPEPLAYAQVCRLGEDAGYFYLFRDQYGGYMIPKEQLGERAESFRAFVEGNTGQRFRSRMAPVIRLMRSLGTKKGYRKGSSPALG